MKKVSKKSFVTWLNRQKTQRAFNFTSNADCLFASYLKEEIGHKAVWCSVKFYSLNENFGETLDIPIWFQDLAQKINTHLDAFNFTSGEVKKYLK
jgi:hypothetical protein